VIHLKGKFFLPTGRVFLEKKFNAPARSAGAMTNLPGWLKTQQPIKDYNFPC
jgi:hypothetical protein